MFELEQLKKIVISEPDESIKAMRKDFSTYVRHVFGTGTDIYLSQINEYENSRQHDLRKAHAIKITSGRQKGETKHIPGQPLTSPSAFTLTYPTCAMA